MNSIHPTAIIQDGVVLGTGNTIGAYAVLTGPLTIGDHNWIGAGAMIGPPPEVRSFEHPADAEHSVAGNGVAIGNGNVIREGAQIHQGWQGVTTIGDDCFIMNQSYVAHDCVIENGVTLASSVLLAGHVHVSERANLGLGVAVHQRRFIGASAMIGMGAVVTRDLPPFAIAHGSPARVRGVNTVGMSRQGYTEGDVALAVAAFETDDYSGALQAYSSTQSLFGTSILRWTQATDES